MNNERIKRSTLRLGTIFVFGILTLFGVVQHNDFILIINDVVATAVLVILALAVRASKDAALAHEVAIRFLRQGATSIEIFTVMGVGIPLVALALICAYNQAYYLSIIYSLILVCFSTLHTNITEAFNFAKMILILAQQSKIEAEQKSNPSAEIKETL